MGPDCTLTHWGRDKMDAIFQTTFLNAFSWMKMYEFRFHWSLFLRVQLQYSSIGSDNGLAPVRRQGIIWTSDGLVHWRIYASLDLNESRPQDNSVICALSPITKKNTGTATDKTLWWSLIHFIGFNQIDVLISFEATISFFMLPLLVT